MPCVGDNVCTVADNNNYATPNLIPDKTTNYASNGYMGFMKLTVPKIGGTTFLRVFNADVNLKQEISAPDVIDGRIDKTVYQLGPKKVDGNISMPLIADNGTVGGCPNPNDLTSAGSLLNTVWCWATARGPHGRLIHNDAVLDIRYANHAAFSFKNTIVNTFGLSVSKGDIIKLDMNVLGRSRSPFTDVIHDPTISDYLAPARVLQWSDITVNGVGGCNPQDLFYSQAVTEFNMEINNNADLYFSLNGSLFPMDINVAKRDVSGSVKLLGLQDRLRVLAETNQNRFTEKNEIRLALYVGQDQYDAASGAFQSRDWTTSTSVPSGAIFGRRLTGVVFHIEEMAMRNGLFETTVNWTGLASDASNYEAFAPQTSCAFPAWI